MVISDEAVEAAAASWLHDWDTTTDGMRMVIRERMQQALEAAAPYMQREARSEAWEECADGYCEQLANITLDWEELPNPYRNQS